MATTYLSTSTLSAAVGRDDNEFTVASTTNIDVGDVLVLRREVMQVREIPVSGRVKVRRGYQGTRAIPHPSGSTFYFGTPDQFKTVRDNAAAVIGDSGTLPDYCLPGTRATDGAGNEFIMVDLTASIHSGATVAISKDGAFTAAVLTSTYVGPVGILTEYGTSDQWVWAQIYGYNAHAKLVGGSSLATSLGTLEGASSVSSPAVGLVAKTTTQFSSVGGAQIQGMSIITAVSSASTSATSETGYFTTVWLNYPYLNGRTNAT